MKRLIVLIALVVSPLSMLFAHPASELTASYPAGQNIMSVKGKHMVSTSQNTDTKKHYIESIRITINGVVINNRSVFQTYRSQNGDAFETKFRGLNLKNGDKIVVTATCNLGGEKTTEFVVSGR